MSDAAAGVEGDATKPGVLDPKNDVEDRYRRIKYTKPAGFEIESDGGVHFVVGASAIRVGNGWGVRARITAWAERRPQKLLTPKRGPLAFRGSVKRKGQTLGFDDQREGDTIAILDERPIAFSRDWPESSNQQPLELDDELRLEVGLWGVSGETSESPLPLPHFFVVRMRGKRHPNVIVEKPAGFK